MNSIFFCVCLLMWRISLLSPVMLQLKEWKTSFILKSFSFLSCFYQDEFHSRLRFNRRGLVAMANAGPHDNGSQFFFTLGRADELNNKHTIFGKVCYTNWSPSLIVTEATRSFSEVRFNILWCYVHLKFISVLSRLSLFSLFLISGGNVSVGCSCFYLFCCCYSS